ncbi:MAG: ABC transporter permease [Phycisphaerales bacterium]|nr:ABC transporter permease [Phycisphaerales bacterium]MCB9837285.1 ABC transporter permease [Phycisphaera sp.]
MTTATTTNEPSQLRPGDGDIDGRPGSGPGVPFDLSNRFVRVVDRSNDGMIQRIREAIQWRDLLFMLVQRDIKVRYRQTAFGIIWAVMVPLLTMAVYWVVFDKLGRMGPDGMPYPLFLFPGMIVFQYFSSSTGRAANSLKQDGALLSKVYFPRLVLPLASITSPLVDFLFGLVILAVILAIYQHPPTLSMLMMPVYLSIAIVSAAGMGMGLSVLNSHFRDVTHFLPVMLHLWFFCSPVLYSTTDRVPEKYWLLYSLNPMVTACEGVRGCLLGQASPVTPGMTLVSCAVAAGLFLCGLVTFMKFEQTVTDVL